MHFLEIAAHGLLLRLVGVGHFDEFTIHLLIVIIKILGLVLLSHLLDLLSDLFPQLSLQILALLRVDGLMLEHDLGMCVNSDPLKRMFAQMVFNVEFCVVHVCYYLNDKKIVVLWFVRRQRLKEPTAV